MPLGLGKQKSRRFGGGIAPPVIFAVALAVGLSLSGSPVARAGDGSAPPKPQVLWHAYPLNPRPAGGTGTTLGVNTGAAKTRPHSAPSKGADAAPRAAQSFPAVALAAAAALAAAIVGVVVLLRRRRAALRGDAVARAAERGGAARGGVSSGAPAEGNVTGTLESVGPEQSEHVERQVAPDDDRARPTAEEKEVLKRKSETTDAEAAAKLKSGAHASASLKHAKERDLTLLKAKLGEPQRKPSRTSVRPKRAHGANGTPAAVPLRCRIDWRADGDDYRFCAIARMPNGEESVLYSSPPLEWNGDAPPSQHLPDAASRITDRETKAIDAYLALVSRLLAEGWMSRGVRERWYELELERTPDHAHGAQQREGRT